MATASWALLFIVRAFFNDTITVAVWTGFHVRLLQCGHTPVVAYSCFADPILAARGIRQRQNRRPEIEHKLSGLPSIGDVIVWAHRSAVPHNHGTQPRLPDPPLGCNFGRIHYIKLIRDCLPCDWPRALPKNTQIPISARTMVVRPTDALRVSRRPIWLKALSSFSTPRRASASSSKTTAARCVRSYLSGRARRDEQPQ